MGVLHKGVVGVHPPVRVGVLDQGAAVLARGEVGRGVVADDHLVFGLVGGGWSWVGGGGVVIDRLSIHPTATATATTNHEATRDHRTHLDADGRAARLDEPDVLRVRVLLLFYFFRGYDIGEM